MVGLGVVDALRPLRGGVRLTARVVVPYTRLEPGVRKALSGERPRYVDVSDHEWAYWRLLYDLWKRAEDVVLVEHDVIPQPGAVRALLGCPRDWCAVPYQQGKHVGTGFGCTKLTGAMMARNPDAVSRIPPQHRSWRALDSVVLGTLRRNGEEEHVHALLAAHLHYDEHGRDLRPPQSRRMAGTMRLLYVGMGRYLNHVPARDFDTDDPAMVAACLESGLYVTLPEPGEAPPEPVAAAPQDAAEAPQDVAAETADV